MLAVNPVSLWVVELAALLTRKAKMPVPVFRSIRNWVSFVLLSAHARLIWVVPAAVAVRFVGASGIVAGVALTSLELALSPPALSAVTTK